MDAAIEDPDAAPLDAAPLDASPADASPPDASPPDAAPPDASLPDAAPPGDDWISHDPQLVSGMLTCTAGFATTGRRIAVDGDGNIHVALVCDGDVLVATSHDRGATYEVPVPVGIADAGEVALAGGDGDVLHVAAVTTTGSGALVYTRSVDGGATFATPASLDTNLQVDRLSLAARGDAVHVLTKSFAAGTPLHLWRSASGGTSFALTTIELDTSYYDVLVDPASDDVWVAANFPGSLRVRHSDDAGVTFDAESVPPGAMPYGDWSLGGGDLVVAGYGSTQLVRVPTSAPTTSSTASGLPLADPKERALSATAAGDVYVVTRLASGAARLDRVLASATAADAADARTFADAADAPGIVALPAAVGAAITYVDACSVYATVQVY